MSDTNIITKWNILDSIIYKLENTYFIIRDYYRENKEPDAEEMIAAATEQLQKENDELKKMHFPSKLIKSDDTFLCPNCKEAVDYKDEIRTRYCAGCGKRIVMPQMSYMQKKRANKLV